jgi:hypothetical protein
MSRPIPIVLLLAALQLTATAAFAEPLGRLFFTPERRAALERQRQLNIQEVQALEGAAISLDGVVVRSSGKRTVWINQHPQHDSDPGTPVAAEVSAAAPGQAALSAGEESTARIKVGESIHRVTRETQDGLGGGRIVVHRSVSPDSARPR